MSLKALLNDIKSTMGLQHKSDIQVIAKHLKNAYQNPFYPNGDDTAAIPNTHGYDLFSGEGFLENFVQEDPWFAGWCGVMVNISDIAAMGGRPTAIINSYWGQDDNTTEKIFEGLSAASQAFKIPIVGGHTNLRAEKPQLAVSILGKANTLLSSFAAKAGQSLIVAIDCRGEYRQPFNNWNAATQAPAERLRGDIELLPIIAENGLATACKDISQAGLLGTCLMMLESSNVGALINMDAVPKPNNIPWQQWLCSFPSFGYLLTADKKNTDAIISLFKKRGIHCTAIGHITHRPSLAITQEKETETFWNLKEHALTGMSITKPPYKTLNNIHSNRAFIHNNDIKKLRKNYA